MSNDMSEFLEVFFEECFEGLEAMESGLVGLEADEAPIETINTIFRAAHSIKGGAATFDMNEVAEFTHVMETLLDEMRDGRRAVTPEAVNLLLTSTDGLKDMVIAIRAGDPVDNERIASLKSELDRMLSGADEGACDASADHAGDTSSDPSAESEEDAQAAQDESKQSGPAACWKIVFKPHPILLETGNDPQHLFRALAAHGPLKVALNASDLPSLADMEPTKCYLSWTLLLESECQENSIQDIFAWVEDECELTLTRLDGAQASLPDTIAPGLDASAGDDSGAQTDNAVTPATAAGPDQLEPANTDAASSGEDGEGASVQKPPSEENGAVAKSDNNQIQAPAQEPPPAASTGAGVAPKSQAPARSSTGSGSSESTSIRVAIDKVDELVNLVGELVITQSMLNRFSEGVEADQLDQLRDGLMALARNTRELQETAMQIRMLPISTCFNRFPRLVRDLSAKLNKKVELQITGGSTELDKTVLEKINDPLVHLVRNSLDHGVESPEKRLEQGKSETGVLNLNAYHEGGNIVIEVVDDGGGLNAERILAKARERGIVAPDAELSDEQVHNLIFQPGFSTAEVVSDVSGRGVGMDVVRRNIQDLGGNVTVDSVAGRGSIFTIRLPLTLAILDGQLVRVGSQTYIISLVSIIESLQVMPERVTVVSGKHEIYKLRDEFIPIVRLYESFNLTPDSETLDKGLLVVVEADGCRVGLFVDDLLGQQQVVIKSLETNFQQVEGLSGATILGDGQVALILDVPGLVQRELANAAARGPRLAA